MLSHEWVADHKLNITFKLSTATHPPFHSLFCPLFRSACALVWAKQRMHSLAGYKHNITFLLCVAVYLLMILTRAEFLTIKFCFLRCRWSRNLCSSSVFCWFFLSIFPDNDDDDSVLGCPHLSFHKHHKNNFNCLYGNSYTVRQHKKHLTTQCERSANNEFYLLI